MTEPSTTEPSAGSSISWAITIDCVDARALAAFWAAALGYVSAPPPTGFESWEQWYRSFDVPEAEWGDGASLVDPTGRGPKIGFLRVPERKTVKNRLHLDVSVTGGRQVARAERESRIGAAVERLVAAGATELARHHHDGGLDHVVLADPEGNEFCVV